MFAYFFIAMRERNTNIYRLLLNSFTELQVKIQVPPLLTKPAAFFYDQLAFIQTNSSEEGLDFPAVSSLQFFILFMKVTELLEETEHK